MSELKTKKNRASVDAFIARVKEESRRDDCLKLVGLMKEVTGDEPAMWGPSIVGFGSYHYKYASGREGDWFLTGFAPRKRDLTLYIMSGFDEHDPLIEKLGKCKTSKCCLYIKKLEDVHLPTLKKLVRQSVKRVAKRQKSC